MIFKFKMEWDTLKFSNENFEIFNTVNMTHNTLF